ncbi:MAG: DUF2135 domain-containing protein [Chloroflexi bacterium]|nr:DUF2135 domain-containing protein [Chloroflexota bacterium]
MKFFCSRCGQRIEVTEGWEGQSVPCPTCGAPIVLPGPGADSAGAASSGSGDPSLVQQRRYADSIMVLCVLAALLALLFFLLRPAGSGAGQEVKKAVFGRKIATAAEAAAAARAGRAGSQQGRANAQASGATNGQAGQAGQPAQGSGTEAAGERAGGTTESDGGPASDSRRRSGRQQNSPINPQHPDSQPGGASSPALPERSIGWLKNFVNSLRPSSGPARPGVAGTNEPAAAVGNTNLPATPENPLLPIADDPNAATAPVQPNPDLSPDNSTSTNVAAAPRAENSMLETNVGLLSDDFSRRLTKAGAKSGDVQISLMWNNVNDLDLHCVDPRGEEIYYQHRRSNSGGELDIDMNAGSGRTTRPVENIYWPRQGAPPGEYKVLVNHYANHGGPDPTQFTLRIFIKGRTQQFTGAVSFRRGQSKLLVHRFTLPGS